MTKKSRKKILVCVAWPYVNGPLHIGHLAGYLLPADIFARFNRLLGNDVAMVSGSDCFGTPATVEADSIGVTPQEIVDKYHPKRLSLFEKANIRFDLFTKTSTKNHIQISQDIFIKLLEKGYIIKRTTKQFYSKKDKKFLPDRYVEGICPNCGYDSARSDQCENCNEIPGPENLKNPRSKITGSKIVLKDTEHYFVDWPKLQPFLEKYFKSHSGKWRLWIQNETEGWLKKGLLPRAVTRDLDWGVPIPVDRIPEDQLIDNIEGKRIYVWFEAVIGYLSATIEWAKKNKRDWREFWYSENTSHVYFMGKDNLVFHALFWPGQLHGYDEKIHLPDVMAINQFLNLGDQKFSKSKKRIVDNNYIIDKYGVDTVRFYLALIMPENTDTSFTWKDFEEKVNGVLIANFGNFINRSLTLAKDLTRSDLVRVDIKVKKRVKKAFDLAKEHLLNTRFKSYLEEILSLSDFGNKYINETKAWNKGKKSAKVDSLYLVLALGLLVKPLLPSASQRIEKYLGIVYESWDDDLGKLLRKVKVSKKIAPLFEKIKVS